MARFFLRNRGFELGDQDWTMQTGWAIAENAPTARSGTWRAAFTGGASAALRNLPLVPCRPGARLSISAYIDSSAATAGNGRVRFSWRDGAGAEISTDESAAIAFGNAGYAQASLNDAVAPARAKSVSLEAVVLGTPAGTWYFDDFEASGEIIEAIPASAIIGSSRMISADTVGRFDPLIGDDKFTDFNAGMSDRWAGVYTFVPALGSDLAELVAFIRRIGRTERFFAFDPDRRIPLGGVVNGLLVDGAVNAGNARIPVRGGTADTIPLVAGDYVEVRAQYFQLQRDLEIGPEGTGEMIVWPGVRATLIDAEEVITDNPKMVARITSDLDWRRIEARPVELTMSWEELA